MSTERTSPDYIGAADKVVAERAAHAPVSQRRPYTQPMPWNWFMKTREYRAYALREVAGVLVGFFVFDLMVGLVSLNMGAHWWQWWVDLQRNPFLMILAGLALIAGIIHTVTWFQLTPSIIRVQRGQKYVADRWVVLTNLTLLVIFAVIMVVWLA